MCLTDSLILQTEIVDQRKSLVSIYLEYSITAAPLTMLKHLDNL